MNDNLRIVAGLVGAAAVIFYVLKVHPDLALYPLAIFLLVAVILAVCYFRLPLLVEARCNDEKFTVVSGKGMERVVLVKDIVQVYAASFGPRRMEDPEPWIEYGVVSVRSQGKADETLRFRVPPSGGNLGTHPALAMLMKRVDRLQDNAKK
ncbi:MAG: hypothetical protein AB8G16_08095 [Gammaproteobacteria bacterium]